jgi:hypothetical protein
MQRIVCAQPLNGYHLTPVGFEAENQTGINGLAIENDGAGATLAFAAPFFGTRIMEFPRSTCNNDWRGSIATSCWRPFTFNVIRRFTYSPLTPSLMY